MSSLYALDATTDTYDIYVSNQSIENELDENEQSSAGKFTVLLQPELNLSSLLYMRSIDAELSLTQLHVNNLPLTMSRRENCQIYLEIDVDTVGVNQYYNVDSLTEFNKVPLTIHLEDHMCKNPEQVVSYVSDIFKHRINNFIMARYLRIVCDNDIMNIESRENITQSDGKLINRYLDCALFVRNEIHNFLLAIIGERATGDNDISKKIQMNGKGVDITVKIEDEILGHSQCLKLKNEREHALEKKTVDLTSFYNIDLVNENTSVPNTKAISDLRGNIKTQLVSWLTTMGFTLTRHSITNSDDINEIKGHIASNIKLIEHAVMVRSLLRLELDRETGQIRTNSKLFRQDILTANTDVSQTRCVFSIFPKQFICEGTSLTIHLPNLLSYTLGGQTNETTLSIGPITTKMPYSLEPRLTNNILSPSQRFYSRIRCVPNVVFIATDSVVTKGRDSWMNCSTNKDYQLIHTYVVDELALRNKAITSVDENGTYYKVKQSQKVLENVNFLILDENLRECVFPQKTLTKIALRIRPVALQ